MVNVLVVDDNFIFAKKIINILVSDNKNVRLCNVCTNGNEVMKLLSSKKENIDVILLDLKLPNFSGLDILRYIEENDLEEYKNSIIVISGEMEMIQKLRNNPYLYSFVGKSMGFELILKEINNLIEIKENEKNSIDFKIHEEIKKLNYNFSYIGTKYMIEAILIMYNENQTADIKLEKDIYSKISKKYKKSINNIKTNIINATDLMYYDCNFEILKNYFGISVDEKPTPKVIMNTILEKLKYNI